ncbi:MAG TPA: hypothetical protein VGX45_04940 [Solirubrobacteraceae bacterium]|jgi:hypothetical protein|nr:hypothetical protein [Solirubrobacteraceae bacterium]
MSADREDLGDPIAYLALDRAIPVYSADGDEVGVVDHVLEDDREDVFEGIVIAHRDDHHHLLGHRDPHVFADADQIDAIYRRGVVLKLSTADAAALPRPSANPAVMRVDPSAPPGTDSKLRRAWDRISGNY